MWHYVTFVSGTTIGLVIGGCGGVLLDVVTTLHGLDYFGPGSSEEKQADTLRRERELYGSGGPAGPPVVAPRPDGRPQ